MKFLFLKRSLSWPLATGHDVHTFHMVKALAELGNSIEIATVNVPAPSALAGLPLEGVHSLASGGRQPPVASDVADAAKQQGANAPRSPQLTRLQNRYLRYWGIEGKWIDATTAIVENIRPDVVVAAGLDMLPCLAAVRSAVRVWYAADEYARHHLSMLKLTHPRTWRGLFETAVAALYERTYSCHIDRIWVVSEDERRAMRRVSGVRAVDVVPNGVDGDYFRPGNEPKIRQSCTFWGRLDATPNIQAVEWFAGTVWPAVRREFPKANFTVFGFNPTEAVRTLDGKNGITVVANTPDLRPVLRRYELAVMPFVSGGGIKNKLLEAAALEMPIVCSPLACGGLIFRETLPLMVAKTTADWVAAFRTLWSNEEMRRRAGVAARRWVLEYHSWEAAARAALAPIAKMGEKRSPKGQMTGSEVSS